MSLTNKQRIQRLESHCFGAPLEDEEARESERRRIAHERKAAANTEPVEPDNSRPVAEDGGAATPDEAAKTTPRRRKKRSAAKK